MSILNLNMPGYSPVASRLAQPLTATQNFNVVQLVGQVTSTGDISPLNTSTVGGIAYAVGVLDLSSLINVPASGIFSSASGQVANILSGSFTLANGTSSNAFAESDLGALAYSADGITANKTSTTNPTNATTGLPSGTATGVVCGIVTAFSTTAGVTITCLPELNALHAGGGGLGTVAIDHGGTGNTTASAALAALGGATAGDQTGATTPVAAGALTATVSGATIGWSSRVGTISAGGPTLGAHLLAGAWITDGTLLALVVDNTALSATAGTITTASAMPALTGTTVSAYRPQFSHTHTEV